MVVESTIPKGRESLLFAGAASIQNMSSISFHIVCPTASISITATAFNLESTYGNLLLNETKRLWKIYAYLLFGACQVYLAKVLYFRDCASSKSQWVPTAQAPENPKN